MFLLMKSISRTVHQCHDDEREKEKNKDSEEASTSLTLWRKSLIFSCSGFIVISPDGRLAYRVDNYTDRPDQVVLMDGSGNPIFTICRRKKLGLLEYWLVYEGEVSKRSTKSSTKPVFCARKHMTKQGVITYVYSDKRCMYVIEGSYRSRSCKILDDSRRVVGEIKRKEATAGGACFGLEVFNLIVRPGFDSGFAMVFVILLDQMFT